ncbi:plasma-membrane proton-efflux P-type ATPase [Acidithiobacillus thiooxidans]|uniref:plasma-membrane proton-efflux P-type ATPase n=1 Tax=Acidithiobacillus thiooxidans TaxID=930 RepID=UPI000262538D|nr:plasma-membrane proton-efflux P-type ATPase [Acidithiobacillus thiooxidans]MBU2812229.1 plasma-membrane proton-efflux P-type ATPase [Acidithiobacillus thiooxidans]
MQPVDAKSFESLDLNASFQALESSDKGLSSSEASTRLAQFGSNLLEEKETPLWRRLISYFWAPIPWMIEVAAVLSAINGDWKSFFVIFAMLLINGGIGFWEEKGANDALKALKNQLALKARVLRDQQWQSIDAAQLVPGDVVRLRLGDILPADIKLISGDYLSVDQSALTGESLPVNKKPGDVAYSGTIAKQGEMLGLVYETGSATFFGRTASLVQKAAPVSHFQKAVLNIGNFLIVLALSLSLLLIVVELFRGLPFLTLLTFVLVVVVASIPVAMPAVLSVTMALGALALSRMKAIVSKLTSIEEMAGVDILCSDKTGTLTQNIITLGESALFAAQNEQELILAAALASKAEDADAIDNAVLAGLPDRDKTLAAFTQDKFIPFDPISKRTEGQLHGSDGKKFRVSKGAPQVLIEMAKLADAERAKAEKVVEDAAAKGFRTLGVVRSDDDAQNWRFLGILSLLDPPRVDSKQTIMEAQEHGIEVKMVTGDHQAIASEIAGQLNLGTHILTVDNRLSKFAEGGVLPQALGDEIEHSDGFAQVFPEHKYAIVKALQQRGHIVAMTGDGVNDAPALKQADVGIAVSGATDAARGAAALILTAPGLNVIVKAVEEARRIFERMTSYTVYRIAMTLDILFFVVVAMLIFNSYPLTAIMVVLLSLLDDIPIMTIAWDHTAVKKSPVHWEMPRVLSLSSAMGLLAFAGTFGLYLLTRFVFHIPLPEAQSIMFLQLIAGGHLMLFLTRVRGPFWRPPHPAPILLLAILGTQIVGVAIVGFGWLMTAVPWTTIGLVWAYNVVWMLLADFAKLGIHRLMDHEAAHQSRFLRTLNHSLHPALTQLERDGAGFQRNIRQAFTHFMRGGDSK